jgi:effector-binding domain-containing protein
MIIKPKLNYRKEQPYAAIRTQVPIPFGKYLPPLWQEVQAWMKSSAISPSGPPFIRYLTTDMSKKLDIEVGFPVAAAFAAGSAGSGRISAGVIPAGNYAVMVYTGSYRGKGLYKATVALLEWAKENAIRWDISLVDQTEWWGGRVEWYLTDPQEEPDPKKWQTELAFRVAD